MDVLSHLVDSSLVIEKLRVSSEVRLAHLERNGQKDVETEDLHNRILELENYVDGRVGVLVKDHPAYPWFSRVKGVGKENIGKVVTGIRVKPEQGYRKKKVEGEQPEKPELILVDLPYADTISALHKFAGFSVEDGKAPKRTAGEKLTYNSQLRSMCWRLGTSLMRAKGKFYEYYLDQKTRYEEKLQASGRQIVPVTGLPKINKKRTETEELISEGHVHNMALRKMIKLFLACLWLEWRKAEGLPVTKPYAIEQLGHDSFISPEEMCDRASKEGD